MAAAAADGSTAEQMIQLFREQLDLQKAQADAAKAESAILRDLLLEAHAEKKEHQRKEEKRQFEENLKKHALIGETSEECSARCQAVAVSLTTSIAPGYALAPADLAMYDTSATGPYKFNTSAFRYNSTEWHRLLREKGEDAKAEDITFLASNAVYARALYEHLRGGLEPMARLLADNPTSEGETAATTALRDALQELQSYAEAASNTAYYNARRLEVTAALQIALAEGTAGSHVLKALLTKSWQNVTQDVTLSRMLTQYENTVRTSLAKQLAATRAKEQAREAELKAEYKRGQADARMERAANHRYHTDGGGGRGKGGRSGGKGGDAANRGGGGRGGGGFADQQ
jgi:hypothetical protein